MADRSPSRISLISNSFTFALLPSESSTSLVSPTLRSTVRNNGFSAFESDWGISTMTASKMKARCMRFSHFRGYNEWLAVAAGQECVGLIGSVADKTLGLGVQGKRAAELIRCFPQLDADP